MASEDRSLSPAVTEPESGQDALLTQGHRYAFFQALRLLRLRNTDAQTFARQVRVRPAVSLAFPDRDIEQIERLDNGKYRITANFFGLYGVTSPLPTFYTEDLITEHLQGNDTPREFLDIVHAALYPLLFQAWEKNRLWLAVSEQHDTKRLRQLCALIGMGGVKHVDHDIRSLLPHAGNFNQFPRSALGLESLLRGLFQDLPVNVEPCVTDTVSIPQAERCLLSEQACKLGESALLGIQMTERTGSLLVHIGPIPPEQLNALLPGSPDHERLVRAISLYLLSPLRCVLALKVPPQHRQGARLGQGWALLGWNTWLPDDLADPALRWSHYDDVYLPIDTDLTRLSIEAS